MRCDFCGRNRVKIGHNKLGYYARCENCRETLQGFDTAKEAKREWMQLKGIHEDLVKFGYTRESGFRERSGKIIGSSVFTGVEKQAGNTHLDAV